MSDERTCQADKQALEVFGDDKVPPCDEEAAWTLDGYRLCEGCVVALEALTAMANLLGEKALVLLGDHEIKRALGEPVPTEFRIDINTKPGGSQ